MPCSLLLGRSGRGVADRLGFRRRSTTERRGRRVVGRCCRSVGEGVPLIRRGRRGVGRGRGAGGRRPGRSFVARLRGIGRRRTRRGALGSAGCLAAALVLVVAVASVGHRWCSSQVMPAFRASLGVPYGRPDRAPPPDLGRHGRFGTGHAQLTSWLERTRRRCSCRRSRRETRRPRPRALSEESHGHPGPASRSPHAPPTNTVDPCSTRIVTGPTCTGSVPGICCHPPPSNR